MQLEQMLEQLVEQFERKDDDLCPFFREREKGVPPHEVDDYEECPQCREIMKKKGTLCACELNYNLIQGCINMLGNGDRAKGQRMLIALAVAIEDERYGGA